MSKKNRQSHDKKGFLQQQVYNKMIKKSDKDIDKTSLQDEMPDNTDVSLGSEGKIFETEKIRKPSKPPLKLQALDWWKENWITVTLNAIFIAALGISIQFVFSANREIGEIKSETKTRIDYIQSDLDKLKDKYDPIVDKLHTSDKDVDEKMADLKLEILRDIDNLKHDIETLKNYHE